MYRLLPCLVMLLGLGLAAASSPDRPGDDPLRERARGAAERGLAIVQKAAGNYPKHRSCFSCHHQTLPMLAMVSARSAGLPIDEKLLEDQARFTHRSFEERIESMKQGSGIGGAAMTVGYGLLALDLAGWKRDETVEAMRAFLLKTQLEDGHWKRSTRRPPLEDSNITCTALAAYGLRRFAGRSTEAEAEAALAKARDWLAAAPVESQEDRVARLWAYDVFEFDPEQRRAAREAILSEQRPDGGWAQLPNMPSDAYATGQTLFVLQATGLPVSEPAYRRGVEFLLQTQASDGSWLVETRSEPIQLFFDNGDPHGEHQFISIAGTSWAVAALAELQIP